MDVNGFSVGGVVLLLRLLTSHVLADFVLQRRGWVEERTRRGWTSIWLYVHSALAAVLAYLFAGLWTALWLPAAVFASHLLLDGWKAQRDEGVDVFVLDQIGHLLVLVLVWALASGWGWADMLAAMRAVAAEPRFWVLLLAYMTVFWPAGLLVGVLTRAWRPGIASEGGPGLERAGLWIGRLERLLVVTAIVVHRFEFIGFLIAAKSVLRFGELRGATARDQAEYVLIGTMLSFTLAVATGLVVTWLLQALPVGAR